MVSPHIFVKCRDIFIQKAGVFHLQLFCCFIIKGGHFVGAKVTLNVKDVTKKVEDYSSVTRTWDCDRVNLYLNKYKTT